MTFRDFIDANKDAKLIHGFLVVKLKSLRRRFNGCNHYFVMGVYIVVCFWSVSDPSCLYAQINSYKPQGLGASEKKKKKKTI